MQENVALYSWCQGHDEYEVHTAYYTCGGNSHVNAFHSAPLYTTCTGTHPAGLVYRVASLSE